MATKELICINCPLGCALTVEQATDGTILQVQGNTCNRGVLYAEKELTAPTRIVTTTVPVVGSAQGEATVSCKTKTDIPKEKISAVIQALKTVSVHAPIAIGDVICSNVADTGVDMVATRSIL